MRRELLVLCALGCGGDTDTPDEFDRDAWTGGDFQFTTTAAEDGCLDGAFEALFMPEGPNSAHDFTYSIPLPAYDELPATYEIDLRDPFVGMPVTVTADGTTFQVRGSVMESVALGQVAYGDCVVTMNVDADMTPVDADTLDGTATVTVSDPRGDDGRCPVFDADPCEVGLTLVATRL